MITRVRYLEARRLTEVYKQERCTHNELYKYLKMALPKFGKFSNMNYDIVGITWLGRLVGICTRTSKNRVMKVGDFVNLSQYHRRDETIPQFFK